MVSHIDIFPTICELVGVDVPDFVQGRSLMPIVRGQAESVREEIFAEGTFHAAYEPQRAIRTRAWKYVRRFDDRTEPVLPNVDDSAGKELWSTAGPCGCSNGSSSMTSWLIRTRRAT
jgi:arylsulfatase A-like enzyme